MRNEVEHSLPYLFSLGLFFLLSLLFFAQLSFLLFLLSFRPLLLIIFLYSLNYGFSFLFFFFSFLFISYKICSFEIKRLNLSESFLYNKLQEFVINFWNSYTYSPSFLLCRLQFIFVSWFILSCINKVMPIITICSNFNTCIQFFVSFFFFIMNILLFS